MKDQKNYSRYAQNNTPAKTIWIFNLTCNRNSRQIKELHHLFMKDVICKINNWLAVIQILQSEPKKAIKWVYPWIEEAIVKRTALLWFLFWQPSYPRNHGFYYLFFSKISCKQATLKKNYILVLKQSALHIFLFLQHFNMLVSWSK